MIHIKRQILVVDHDLAVCRAIYDGMRDEFTDVCYMTSAVEVLVDYMKQEYSLVILGSQLAMMSDMELLRILRKANHMPILVLADFLSPEDKVELFHAGADACIDKPLNIEVCIAQANALTQRYMESDVEKECSDIIAFGTKLIICPRYRQVVADGKTLSLTKKEFDLLHFFAQSPKQVFSRTQLYEQVWNEDSTIGVDEIVKAHIKSLRKKLGFMGKEYIQTVWGTGYKFVLDNSES